MKETKQSPNYSNMMAAADGLDALASLGNGFAQSSAIKAQNHYEQTMADINRRFAERQATETIQMGERAASAHKKKVHQMAGSQRAALAAQGVDVGSGSALDAQVETLQLGYQDALQIKNNAWREAWGYKVSADNIKSQAGFNNLAAKNQSRNTLLTGGLSFLSKGAKAGMYLSSEDAPQAKETGASAGQSYTNFGRIA